MAICSVSSKTSLGGSCARISASDVSASRPASIASMSSWLFLAAAGGGGAATGLGAAATSAGGTRGGVRTGVEAFGGAGGGSTFGAAAAWVPAGLVSSSAMIRLIDARISSIEGSCAFAGCVIADPTSPHPLGVHSGGTIFCVARSARRTRHESLRFPSERYVRLTIDCKQRAVHAALSSQRSQGTTAASAAVRRANTDPTVAHLLIVHARIIDAGVQPEHLRRETADSTEHAVGRDDAVVLRRHQRIACGH